MTELALQWLRQMNGAIAARNLYPLEHPRVVRSGQELQEITVRLTRDRPEVSLFVIDGRLTCDGALVPGTDKIATRAFDAIQAAGFDRITFTRGVSTAELEWLVGVLAGKAGPAAGGSLLPTAHIRFSAFAADRPTQETAATLAASTRTLPTVWDGIDQRRSIDAAALEIALLPLVQIVGRTSGKMIPLEALRSHDDYTATHITNVAILTMALAQAFDWSDADLRQIGVAALLHDVGKMKVPSAILSSKERLTADELVLMRRHPETGARMLLETSGMPHLAPIVAYEHHLQNNGGGYPSVPAGWTIHPASAMTHVADVYDALRSNRPYRGGLEHSVIVDMMMRDSGTVFPPQLLEVFFNEVVPRTTVLTSASPETSNEGLRLAG